MDYDTNTSSSQLCQCYLVLCRVEKMQVGSWSGNLRKNRVGSVLVESGNVNKKLLHFFLPADKSAN